MNTRARWTIGILVALVIGLVVGLIIVIGDDNNNSGTTIFRSVRDHPDGCDADHHGCVVHVYPHPDQRRNPRSEPGRIDHPGRNGGPLGGGPGFHGTLTSSAARSPFRSRSVRRSGPVRSAATTSISASRRKRPPGPRAGCGREASRCMWRRRSGASGPSSDTWPTRVRNGSPPRSVPATTCWSTRSPAGAGSTGPRCRTATAFILHGSRAWRRARARASSSACTGRPERSGTPMRPCVHSRCRASRSGPVERGQRSAGGRSSRSTRPSHLRTCSMVGSSRSGVATTWPPRSMTRARPRTSRRAWTPWRTTSSAGTPATGRSMTSFRIRGCGTWRAPRTTACTSCSCGRCRSSRPAQGCGTRRPASKAMRIRVSIRRVRSPRRRYSGSSRPATASSHTGRRGASHVGVAM